jgi:hypothetical protein
METETSPQIADFIFAGYELWDAAYEAGKELGRRWAADNLDAGRLTILRNWARYRGAWDAEFTPQRIASICAGASNEGMVRLFWAMLLSDEEAERLLDENVPVTVARCLASGFAAGASE